MRAFHFAAGVVAFVLSACNVTEIPPPPTGVAMNECDGNEDCPGGACSDGACTVGSSVLRSLIVEVTPPPGGVLAPLTYYTTLDDKLSDIVLQPPAKLAGYVTLHPETCQPTFSSSEPGTVLVPVEGTIPVDVTFTPSARTLGLPTRSYRSEPLEQGEDGKHGFELQVPPGDYDVYIEPGATTPDSKCQIPPWLLLKQHIAASGSFDVKLSLPSSITIPVHWPTASLDFWSVEMLDSASGRILSAPAVLGNPGLDDDGRAFYQATVAYSRALVLNSSNELVVSDGSYELVRISPPEGTIAPSILGEASVIGLSATNQGGILLSAPLPAPVLVEAQTAEASTTEPVPAAVTLTATRIEGMDQGLYGSFVRTYHVATDTFSEEQGVKGLFRALVPPGDYLVDAIPKTGSSACEDDGCPALSSRRDVWQVGTAPERQAGKLIQFQRAPTVRGNVFSSTGKAVAGAVVRVTSSVFNAPADAWDQLDRAGVLTPLATAGLVDGRGAFRLSADPGTFDLFVQPDPSTRFGWYVRPQLKVNPRDDLLSIGTLTVPLARRYAGTVLIGSKMNQPFLPNALIRAYVYVTPQGEYAATPQENGAVLQVAETRSNSTGDYELLIPASLDSPVPPAD